MHQLNYWRFKDVPARWSRRPIHRRRPNYTKFGVDIDPSSALPEISSISEIAYAAQFQNDSDLYGTYLNCWSYNKNIMTINGSDHNVAVWICSQMSTFPLFVTRPAKFPTRPADNKQDRPRPTDTTRPDPIRSDQLIMTSEVEYSYYSIKILLVVKITFIKCKVLWTKSVHSEQQNKTYYEKFLNIDIFVFFLLSCFLEYQYTNTVHFLEFAPGPDPTRPANLDRRTSLHITSESTASSSSVARTETRCSAIAKRPRCRVR